MSSEYVTVPREALIHLRDSIDAFSWQLNQSMDSLTEEVEAMLASAPAAPVSTETAESVQELHELKETADGRLEPVLYGLKSLLDDKRPATRDMIKGVIDFITSQAAEKDETDRDHAMQVQILMQERDEATRELNELRSVVDSMSEAEDVLARRIVEAEERAESAERQIKEKDEALKSTLASLVAARSQHINRMIALDMIESAITHPRFRP
jgi:hypothetical protein